MRDSEQHGSLYLAAGDLAHWLDWDVINSWADAADTATESALITYVSEASFF